MIKATITTVGVSAVLIGAVVTTNPVFAQNTSSTTATSEQQADKTISIPVDTVKRGDDGSIHELVVKNIQNGTYSVAVKALNQSSVHPNSDIILQSGDSIVTVTDVEREKFLEETGEGSLVVENGKVVISVKLGEDKVFSGGVNVELTEVVEQEPEEVEVKEDEAEATPKEVVEDDATEETPVAELPQTGAGAIIGSLIGTGALGYGVHAWLNSRRALHRISL